MIRDFFRGGFWGTHGKRQGQSRGGRRRPLAIEPLESRELLSVTLPTLAAQSLAAGTTLSVALLGSSTTTTDPITYTAVVSNSDLTNASVSSPQLTVTVPAGNPSLQITVDDPAAGISGSMVFQLANDLVPDAITQIEKLVQADFYSNHATSFYRVVNDPSDNFIIAQGGANANAETTHWDDDINQSLQFTSAGVLAMANSGPDTNGSEFFISGDATRYLDYRYTVSASSPRAATSCKKSSPFKPSTPRPPTAAI